MTEEHRRWMWRLLQLHLTSALFITLHFAVRSFFTVDGFSCLLWDLETFHGEIYVTDNAKDFFPVPPGIDFEGNQLLGFGLRYSDKMGTVACIPLWAFIGVKSFLRRTVDAAAPAATRARPVRVTAELQHRDHRPARIAARSAARDSATWLIVKPPPPARFTR